MLKKFDDVTKVSAVKCRETVAQAKKTQASMGKGSSGYDGDSAFLSAEDERQGLLDRGKRQQLLAAENDIAFNEALIAEREAGLLEVEQTVNELADIMRDMAHLVNEQGAMVDTIETNVGSTAARVEGGVKELEKASQYQKSSRNKMCCLLVVILAAGLAVTLFLTKGFKNL